MLSSLHYFPDDHRQGYRVLHTVWPRMPPSRGCCTSWIGATHAPHHVFAEWADKYRGEFDDADKIII